jgi:ubiquinone/menaquinone biosynthesis C-methylase UbiE
MLAGSGIEQLGPTSWADLGCGDGTFTIALAEALAADSVIHALDLDGAAFRQIPAAHDGVRNNVHCGDFMKQPWPFTDLDGILMANSLHYVEMQAAFISGMRIAHESEAAFPDRRIRHERGQSMGPVSS